MDKTRQDKTTLFYQGSPVSCKDGILRGKNVNDDKYVIVNTGHISTLTRSNPDKNRIRQYFSERM